MTVEHRNRMWFAAAIVVVGLGLSLTPIFAGEGLLAGLGIFALALIPAAVILGIIAFVWHGNDKEKRAIGSFPDAAHKR